MSTTSVSKPRTPTLERARGWLAAALPLLLGAGCAGGQASGRYVLAQDPGSRYDFEFVQDRETGRWVQRECELRVAAARELPDPLNDPRTLQADPGAYAEGADLASAADDPSASGAEELDTSRTEADEGGGGDVTGVAAPSGA